MSPVMPDNQFSVFGSEPSAVQIDASACSADKLPKGPQWHGDEFHGPFGRPYMDGARMGELRNRAQMYSRRIEEMRNPGRFTGNPNMCVCPPIRPNMMPSMDQRRGMGDREDVMRRRPMEPRGRKIPEQRSFDPSDFEDEGVADVNAYVPKKKNIRRGPLVEEVE